MGRYDVRALDEAIGGGWKWKSGLIYQKTAKQCFFENPNDTVDGLYTFFKILFMDVFFHGKP